MPNPLDIQNAKSLSAFYNRPKIKERLLIVGNGAKEEMVQTNFKVLFNSLYYTAKLNRGIKESIS